MAREQCKNCVFKDDYFNLYKQGDAIVLWEKRKEYCHAYDKGIPNKIVKNEIECKKKYVNLNRTPSNLN